MGRPRRGDLREPVLTSPPVHHAHPGAPRCQVGRAYRVVAGRPQGCPAAARRGPGVPCVPSGTPSGRCPRRICGPKPRPDFCRRDCRPQPPPHRASCAAAAAGAGVRPRAGCRTGPTRRPAAGGSGWPRRSRNSPASQRLRRPRLRGSPERPSCRGGHCGPTAGEHASESQRSRQRGPIPPARLQSSLPCRLPTLLAPAPAPPPDSQSEHADTPLFLAGTPGSPISCRLLSRHPTSVSLPRLTRRGGAQGAGLLGGATSPLVQAGWPAWVVTVIICVFSKSGSTFVMVTPL